MPVYQAITTKFIAPTNFKGSRVKATAQAGSITLHWSHALNSEDNHTAAAEALAIKLDWKGAWHSGAMPNSSGYTFVVSTEPMFTVQ